jgi:hypothetical protein
MTAKRRIRADTPLRDCPERSVGLALPVPVSERLDGLVSLAEANGERTNRKELVASMILATPVDGTLLVEDLRRYRRSSAGEAQLYGPPNESTLPLVSHRPGPRPRLRGMPRGEACTSD